MKPGHSFTIEPMISEGGLYEFLLLVLDCNNIIKIIIFSFNVQSDTSQNVYKYCIVFKYLYSAPQHGQTEALLVRLAPRKETSFKK